jgi:prepilin-type N-terminal cleavage/methylation domain-containing protein
MKMPISKVGTLNNRMRKKEGFTLIELILVITVIGVIAAIVFPRLDPFLPKRRLKSAARLLSGTISLAYGEAIAENRTYRLYLDTMEDRYWISEVKTSEETEEDGSAPGIRLGTQFELLQYEDGAENIEESMPAEPLLAPKALPDGVHFSSVDTDAGSDSTALDLPYIEFGPIGNASPATIILITDDGEQFAVYYDGVTGMPVPVPMNGVAG